VSNLILEANSETNSSVTVLTEEVEEVLVEVGRGWVSVRLREGSIATNFDGEEEGSRVETRPTVFSALAEVADVVADVVAVWLCVLSAGALRRS